ncbi:MAG: hypothetical protein Q8Q39_03275 [bacterium]|nr:hypothetical protein [bacterium]
MKVKNFEKNIRHLTQEELLTGGMSSLQKILVAKGITTKEELQAGLLAWMAARPEGRRQPSMRSRVKRPLRIFRQADDSFGASGAY